LAKAAWPVPSIPIDRANSNPIVSPQYRIVRIDAVFAHRPRGEHTVARTAGLGDRFVEQAVRHRRSDQAVHRHSAGGEAKDRHVVRIAAERRDVALDPLQGGNLVHVSVVALGFVRPLAAQGREGEEPEAPQAVID
jgi:hypothetical protein